MEPKEVEEFILNHDQITKYFENKSPKKVIVVKGRIINIVI
jgi:leucyl-tRNA synthetase